MGNRAVIAEYGSTSPASTSSTFARRGPPASSRASRARNSSTSRDSSSERRRRRRSELEALLVEEFRARLARGLAAGPLRAKVDEVEAGDVDPYSAMTALLPVISLEPS